MTTIVPTPKEVVECQEQHDSWMISLMSKDGRVFKVRREIATMMGTVKAALEDTDENDVIPISNVDGNILQKVIEFCEYRYENPLPPEPEDSDDDEKPELSDEEKKLMDEYLHMNHETLFQLIIAANFLNCESLLHVTSESVAAQIRGKTTEAIRRHFNITNDFSPEEEERVYNENSWCEGVYENAR